MSEITQGRLWELAKNALLVTVIGAVTALLNWWNEQNVANVVKQQTTKVKEVVDERSAETVSEVTDRLSDAKTSLEERLKKNQERLGQKIEEISNSQKLEEFITQSDPPSTPLPPPPTVDPELEEIKDLLKQLIQRELKRDVEKAVPPVLTPDPTPVPDLAPPTSDNRPLPDDWATWSKEKREAWWEFKTAQPEPVVPDNWDIWSNDQKTEWWNNLSNSERERIASQINGWQAPE